MDPTRRDREMRRTLSRDTASQAMREAMVRFDQAGARVMQLSRDMAARPREDAVVARATHGLGFDVVDPLQLSVVHAWEDFLSAFYAALNRYAAFFSLTVDH